MTVNVIPRNYNLMKFLPEVRTVRTKEKEVTRGRRKLNNEEYPFAWSAKEIKRRKDRDRNM
jgi:hypothetical protein